ncbi:MAG: hypothetical protein LBQ94_05600 [Treponema sp.]|jgi:hypothetical protein|nr:hypothetical protein [Treponema sp.]
MITIFDNATPTSLATNAACPQRPSWQISPVGYKWAQAVLLDCRQAQVSKISKRAEITPMLKKARETVLFAFSRAIGIFGKFRNIILIPERM